MNDNRFIIGGIVGGLSAVLIYLIGKNIIISIMCGLVLFILFAIIFKQRNVSMPTDLSSDNDVDSFFKYGENQLKILSSYIPKIIDMEIKHKASEACKTIRNILNTLKEKPENIPETRKFFNYYIPTLGNILNQYQRVERAGSNPSMRQSVSKYLDDISIAVNKQYQNLFEDDVLDMSLDMKVMTDSLKQDGLLPDNNIFSVGKK